MVKRVKKKRIRIIPILVLLILIGVVYLIGNYLYHVPVKNIIVYDNVLLSDQEIIDLANLSDYPSYYKYRVKTIENKIKKNKYIEKVNVKRSFFHVLKIYVTEYKILLYDYPNDNFILSNGERINTDNIAKKGYPTLLNYVSDEVYDRFIKKLSTLNANIINQISEIKYEPSNYDNGRFLLTMNDGNYVYINLSNFKSLNLYNDIYPNFDGHIGILYLDSGYGEASEYKILK